MKYAIVILAVLMVSVVHADLIEGQPINIVGGTLGEPSAWGTGVNGGTAHPFGGAQLFPLLGSHIQVNSGFLPGVPSPGGAIAINYDPVQQAAGYLTTDPHIEIIDITGLHVIDTVFINGPLAPFATVTTDGFSIHFEVNSLDIFEIGQTAYIYWTQEVLVPPCPEDIDIDGEVGVADLLLLLAQWGICPIVCPGDINGDGVINVPDLLQLLGAWGSCDT